MSEKHMSLYEEREIPVILLPKKLNKFQIKNQL